MRANQTVTSKDTRSEPQVPAALGTRRRHTGSLDAGSHSSPSQFDIASREISEKDFQCFQQLIYRESGIWLSPAKTALLTGRIAKRIRHHGLKSFREYYRLVVENGDERIQMLDAISTNETHFFREPKHFELLRSTVFPEWVRKADMGRRVRRIRVLSAGCSTGQEPYSLAMALLHHFPPASGWEIEITASDLSTRVLEIAKKGIWPAEKMHEIPPEYLKAFMLRGFGEHAGKIKAGPEIRSLIQFYRVNLNESLHLFSGKFDLIFCRNVLIYFNAQSREQVVRRLASHLSDDGYFFVGHAESLHQMGDVLSTLVPTVYRPAQRS